MPNNFNLTEEDLKLVEKVKRLMSADPVLNSPLAIDAHERTTVKEVLTTDSASILLPQIVQLVVKEAAEPEYIGARLLQTVRMTSGTSIEFPVFSALKASKVPETGEYPMQELDIETFGGPTTVKIDKYGLRVAISDEMIKDSQWDVIGMHLRAAGNAMARLKEQIIFDEFRKHAHVVFDNALRDKIDGAGTTGMNFSGDFNDTLSTADLIHMVAVLINNDCRPTDIIMNPLCIPLFAQNEFIKAYTGGAFANTTMPDAGRYVQDPLANGGPALGGINVIYSPFVHFDRVTKRFDLYMIDRTNLGVLLVKDDISTDQFNDPTRDILNLKVMERYGVGVFNEGRNIVLAKNIAYARSFEAPDRIYTVPMPANASAAFDRLLG